MNNDTSLGSNACQIMSYSITTYNDHVNVFVPQIRLG